MPEFTGKTALVVDDEASVRLLLREALEELGLEVSEAVDGADAIEQSLETQFDLVTMDILMPNVNGLDAIRALRMVDPDYRIIVVSSCTEEKYLRTVRELGVADFIPKPVRLAELYAAVRRLLPADRPSSAARPPHDGADGG